jgi:wyosine [tRNA(Phe)-imidazoG37] synthetase (radical SAM superfamily)
MIEFRKLYINQLIIEILFVKGLNDNDNEIEQLSKALQLIEPNRVDIGTIDRPPAYNVKQISYDELFIIAKVFKNQNISIAHRDKVKLDKYLNKDEILNLLHKRPQTKDDIVNLLDKESNKIFQKLLEDKEIEIINISGVDFYKK